MKQCPWCNSESVVRNSPIGFFVECGKNGHIHNVGCFKGAKSFHKTENEAVNEWNKSVKQLK